MTHRSLPPDHPFRQRIGGRKPSGLPPKHTNAACFINADGEEQRRRRNPDMRKLLIDLDYMSRDELREFARSAVGKTGIEWAKELFPDRPIGFLKASLLLRRMAIKMAIRQNAESLYRQLPPWAQYRKVFNILACVAPGKKFRKNVPRRKP